jgi:phospholipid N-methyltransferase
MQNPGEIGQVAPSSRFLADAMVAKLDLTNARAVVEFGPGTGSVTRAIVERCGKNTAFFAIESNSTMISILRRRFPEVEIIHDSAEHINLYVDKYKLGEVDYIISSLPFALLEPPLQKRIVENSYKALRPGGIFVAYQYVHARLINSVTRALRSTFDQIDSSVIFRNLPPAFIFQCLKKR